MPLSVCVCVRARARACAACVHTRARACVPPARVRRVLSPASVRPCAVAAVARHCSTSPLRPQRGCIVHRVGSCPVKEPRPDEPLREREGKMCSGECNADMRSNDCTKFRNSRCGRRSGWCSNSYRESGRLICAVGSIASLDGQCSSSKRKARDHGCGLRISSKCRTSSGGDDVNADPIPVQRSHPAYLMHCRCGAQAARPLANRVSCPSQLSESAARI